MNSQSFEKKKLIHLKKNNRRGFTLIEILLVTALLSAVSLAVMTTFIQGLKIYARFSGILHEQEKAFVLEKITRDLKNGASYSLVPWTLEKNSASFPSMTPLASKETVSAASSLVKIGYRFDPQKKEIIRDEFYFPFQGPSAKTEVLAQDILSLEFDFLREGDEVIPTRVTVSIEYGSQAHSKLISQRIIIPASYKEVK